MMYSIYGIVCPMSGKIVYVGQTCVDLQKRLKAHKQTQSGKKMEAWMSVVKENYLLDSISIVLLAEGFSKDEIHQQERNYIQKHHAQFPLLNGNKTGEKCLWHKKKDVSINAGKKHKWLNITPEAVSKLKEKANEQGQTFKCFAQNILEQAAKKLK